MVPALSVEAEVDGDQSVEIIRNMKLLKESCIA
jgi:hypothetical protein